MPAGVGTNESKRGTVTGGGDWGRRGFQCTERGGGGEVKKKQRTKDQGRGKGRENWGKWRVMEEWKVIRITCSCCSRHQFPACTAAPLGTDPAAGAGWRHGYAHIKTFFVFYLTEERERLGETGRETECVGLYESQERLEWEE